ncbi:MAG: ubiquinone anaerobic biosynthesis accessory factor UbiT [Pseudomonadota bacterium]
MIAPQFPAPLRALVASLPAFPPSAVFALGLSAALGRVIPTEPLAALRGRRLRIVVTDIGLTVNFTLTGSGARPCTAAAAPELTIAAGSRDFLRLLARAEDPDTLFFSRRLTLEGDTELGLTIKNTLDAVDWPPPAVARLLALALRGAQEPH